MEHDLMTCEVCDGPANFLGNLGDVAHYRCRDCGMQFSVDGAEGDADDDFEDWEEWEYDYEDSLSDVEADSMTLASAGMGMDEDYGGIDYHDMMMEEVLWPTIDDDVMDIGEAY